MMRSDDPRPDDNGAGLFSLSIPESFDLADELDRLRHVAHEVLSRSLSGEALPAEAVARLFVSSLAFVEEKLTETGVIARRFHQPAAYEYAVEVALGHRCAQCGVFRGDANRN